MAVRFATFNVENLFARPRVFNLATWADGQPVLDAYGEVSALIAQATYTAAIKRRLIELLTVLEIYRRVDGVVRRNRTPNPRWAWLRANRGTFDVERKSTGIEIVADGRDSWSGWVELAVEPVDEAATQMTARVIADLNADILAVVEAEDRPALDRFNDELLAGRYGHCMLIDGNDTRGIDVGLLTIAPIEIDTMRSNVDVADPVTDEHLFSRDCAEFRCRLPGDIAVWVLVNHFKSQSGGGGGAKRARQARGVRDVVERLIAAGEPNIVVMGDLNEGPAPGTSTAANLAALFDGAGPLVDIYSLPVFDPGLRPGTFQSCGLGNRFDYILVSQALAPRVTAGGIERRGLWGTPTNINPPAAWGVYPELAAGGARHSASDHAAVYIDIDL